MNTMNLRKKRRSWNKMFSSADRKRRIERLEKLYSDLDNEETDIICEYEEEYGQPDNWDEDITQEFYNLTTPIQQAMDTIYNLKAALKNGFMYRSE